MRPLEFNRLGISLSQTAESESLQRTVVGRLYYGLHHEACCRYFRNNPTSRPLNRNRRHTDLRERYNRDVDPKSKDVGILLNDLMTLRAEADYQLILPMRFKRRSLDAKQFLGLAVNTAQQLLDALEDYSPGEAQDGCECPQAYMSG